VRGVETVVGGKRDGTESSCLCTCVCGDDFWGLVGGLYVCMYACMYVCMYTKMRILLVARLRPNLTSNV
jgi:hypothetical protein